MSDELFFSLIEQYINRYFKLLKSLVVSLNVKGLFNSCLAFLEYFDIIGLNTCLTLYLFPVIYCLFCIVYWIFFCLDILKIDLSLENPCRQIIKEHPLTRDKLDEGIA